MSLRAQALVRFADHSKLADTGVTHSVYTSLYAGGAPWDIGIHQPTIERLEREGLIKGNVLDVGCGRGDNTLFLSSKGYSVIGIDYVSSVVEHAKKRASQAGDSPMFRHMDLFNCDELGAVFNTIIDSATFHGLSDSERPKYAIALGRVCAPRATLHILGFGDQEMRSGGPRRLSEQTFRSTFEGTGWIITRIESIKFVATGFDGGADALLCSLAYVG